MLYLLVQVRLFYYQRVEWFHSKFKLNITSQVGNLRAFPYIYSLYATNKIIKFFSTNWLSYNNTIFNLLSNFTEPINTWDHK